MRVRALFRTLSVVLLLLVIAPPSVSQLEFKFSGYAVNFPVYQKMNDLLSVLTQTNQEQFVDVTRLRLRPSLDLSANLFLNLEYEINATFFSAPLLFLPQSQTRRQLVDLTWNPVNRGRWTVLHYVDRLYLRHSSGMGDFTVGRQRISWGTGRVWNPTDLFNPLNPASFSKIEKDGVDAVLGKFVLGNFSDFSVVVNPGEKFQRANVGGRLRTNMSGYDFSLMGGVFDERRIFGLDFAGSIFDAGIRGEGIISACRGQWRDSFVKYILGIDNQFTESLYAMIEYHYNGEGKAKSSEYELQRLVNGEILNLGKQFITAQVSYLLHSLVTVSLSTTRCLTDGSGFVAGMLAYSAADEVAISLGGQSFYGDDFDEYWFYPSALYLRGEFYF